MISGPEQARLLKEFEVECFLKHSECGYHHEEGLSTQRVFKEQAVSLAQVINDQCLETPSLITMMSY